jgi:beta-N-acetylhexosaminidase
VTGSIRGWRPAAVAALAAVMAVILVACGSTPSGPASGAGQDHQDPTATAASTPACTNRTMLATWTLTELAEQTVVVPVNETDVAAVTAEVAAGAGGVILFGSQVPAGFAAAVSALVGRAPRGIPPFVMTDEEGGDVQRLPNLVGDIPSARQMAATMSAAQIQQLAEQAGKTMKANGITMDLAPVLDLDDRPGPSVTNPDGTRSFSLTAQIAQTDGIAFAQGLRAAGVVPVVKHFPGLGYATGNTDSVHATTLPWDTLRNDGLLPFAAAVQAGLPAVMVANASVPGLTTLPASVSPEAITTVLRGQLHFDGLVMTDTLSSASVGSAGFTVPAATVAALHAGADMTLFTSTSVAELTGQIVQAVVAAVGAGQLSRDRLEDAAGHILAAKNVTLCHS